MIGSVLKELYVYPIKSTGGIALQEARVDSRGIEYDRRWMLVDESHKFMSQRKHPCMALISTKLTSEYLVVEAPEMSGLRLPLRPEGRTSIEVRVWSDTVRAVPVGREADEWFSAFLGSSCRLVYMPEDEIRQVDPEYAGAGDHVGFVDGFPFLMVSQASLDDLGERLDRQVPVDRFRPNLVVEGGDAFDEDDWQSLSIGGVDFRVAKPCSRCSIVMTDQSSGNRDREVLATLATYRRTGNDIFFGQNLAHDSTGILRVGDAVELR
ncbi:MAG: MOSC N-terminal beta barrel domain-containing protein [Rubrobacteraceae bacterium]